MYNKSAILIILTLVISVHSAKILGVFQAPSRSHHAIGIRLMKELAARGHEVTFITPHPQKIPVKNLRDIEMTGFLERMQETRKGMNMFDRMNLPSILLLMMIGSFGLQFTEEALSNANVQNLLHSNETFDLIIKEQFLDDALQGLSYYFKAPVLILSTLGQSIWTNRLVGNPAPPSYVVDTFLNYPPKMSFLQRTCNTLVMMIHEVLNMYYTYQHNNLLHKYFPSAPHINDLIYNTSFVLLNSHFSIDPAVPFLPNMAHIGGFHVEPPKKLPEDLQQFLDDAKEGVVYFSLGSNLRSADLPAEKRDAILKVFAGLKFKVLWKWEEDELPGQPTNVKIQKWLPQQDILAHPNIKLFITHGGLLSTIEAIYHGVPVIGIPIFGDQMLNMENAVRNGFGYLLPYQTMSEDALREAVAEVTKNPKYSETAKERSRLLHDQPLKPIDNAVYWTEYVIKHKGAPHLRSAALSLSWYQYLLLDVVLFLTTIAATLTILSCIILKKLFCSGKRNLKQKIN